MPETHDNLTPAEQGAIDKGLPVLPVIPFHMLRVASGNPIILTTADGQEILVRLFTPEELIADVIAAGGGPMSMDKATELTRPLPF